MLRKDPESVLCTCPSGDYMGGGSTRRMLPRAWFVSCECSRLFENVQGGRMLHRNQGNGFSRFPENVRLAVIFFFSC